MSGYEITLTLQDKTTVRAETPEGASASDQLQISPLDLDIIRVFEDWLAQDRIRSRRHLQVFGSILHRALFNGRVRSLFQESYRRAGSARQRLRIQLSFDPEAARFASLPWEFLYDPDSNRFLSTDRDFVLSRYLPLDQERSRSLAPSSGKLRLLIAVSQPSDQDVVSSADVVAAIKKLEGVLPIEVRELDEPNVENFINELEEYQPDLLHYMGHGRFNPETNTGEVALLDDDCENARWIPDYAFADYFKQMSAVPRLAILHLCEGGKVDMTSNFAGLAPQLMVNGVQALVAMQYPITNQAAVSFSTSFYRSLARGSQVDDSVQTGRWKMTVDDLKAYDSRTFGTPVLYMRSRDGIISPSAEGAPE